MFPFPITTSSHGSLLTAKPLLLTAATICNPINRQQERGRRARQGCLPWGADRMKGVDRHGAPSVDEDLAGLASGGAEARTELNTTLTRKRRPINEPSS